MAFSTMNDEEVISEINITPLVDVMLVLLVAFIVTMPLLNKAVDVNLPKTEASAPAPESTVAVSVDRAGQLFVDQRPVARTQMDAEFAQLHAARPDVQVSLQGDEGAPYGSVATVLAALEHAGITRLAVLTRPED